MGRGPGGARRQGARLPLHLRDPPLSAALPLAALALWGLLFLRGLLGLRTAPRAQPHAAPRDERVTAYVPARDEAEIVEEAMRALLAQGAELSRAVVVDDRSSDATPAILAGLAAAEPRLVVLAGRGPAPGECGKPAALSLALEQAPPETPWLLFLDADVVLRPRALAGLLALAEAQGADLVSLIPEVERRSALEELVLPFIGSLLLAIYPPARLADPKDRKAFANGQLILIRRERYQAAGTHRAVVGEVLEDVRLAERVKAAGGRLCLADGRAAARTRMYASGAELREGWTKNLYLLLGGRPLPALGWLGLSLLLAWAGPLSLVLSPWPLGPLVYAAILAMQVSLRALGGARPLWAVAAPLSALLVALIALESAWLLAVRRRVRWKGREYAQ